MTKRTSSTLPATTRSRTPTVAFTPFTGEEGTSLDSWSLLVHPQILASTLGWQNYWQVELLRGRSEVGYSVCGWLPISLILALTL